MHQWQKSLFLLFQFLLFNNLLNAESNTKVLINIEDFVDQQNSKSLTYLKSSIPEALATSIEKTNRFYVKRVDKVSGSDSEASSEDLALSGSFVELSDTVQMQLQVKKLNGVVVVRESATSSIDSSLFNAINQLAETTSSRLMDKLNTGDIIPRSIRESGKISLVPSGYYILLGANYIQPLHSSTNIQYDSSIPLASIQPGLSAVIGVDWNGYSLALPSSMLVGIASNISINNGNSNLIRYGNTIEPEVKLSYLSAGLSLLFGYRFSLAQGFDLMPYLGIGAAYSQIRVNGYSDLINGFNPIIPAGIRAQYNPAGSFSLILDFRSEFNALTSSDLSMNLGIHLGVGMRL